MGGEREGALLVRVTAAPAEGAANGAILLAVARALDVAPSELRILRGERSRRKTLSAPAVCAAALQRLGLL